MTDKNRHFRLAARPRGLPTRDTWTLTEEAIPTPKDGELLLKVKYISLDPAMRGWLNAGRSYIEPVAVGDVMRAAAVAEVVASKSPGFAAGDIVTGAPGVQEYAISDGRGLLKVDPSLAPLPRYLGALGLPGMTAYFGLLDIGQPKEGDTVLVSGAAGAVGSVAGQIARIKGCKVIGIAGGADKCRHLIEELGYAGAIDYKSEDLNARLKELCPEGLDVYFDNVGGPTLDAALAHLRRGARVVICGAISQYNAMDEVEGPRNYLSLLINRARMEGLVVFDYAPRYGEAARDLAGWIAAGQLRCRETVVSGFEKFPEVFLKLFSGEKLGKLVLEVS